MKLPFLLTTLIGIMCFSSLIGEENPSLSFSVIEKNFQLRWNDFQGNEKKFPLWNPHWKEKELKSHFEQLAEERWKVYFTNPEDYRKPRGIGHYRSLYETPKTFGSWNSRYPYPLTFNYNLATPQYNASILFLNGKKFLALEAPCQENIAAFYQVLQQHQVTDLVRLTAKENDHRENSYPYWEGHIDINPKNGRNTLEIEGNEIQYFFTDKWEDHQGLSPEKLVALVKAVYQSENTSQTIAVHCRAGVGRTGTFLAACALIHEIDSQIKKGIDPDSIQVSIDKIFWELSLQRPFMIPHFSQYVSLHQLVSWYITYIKSQKNASSISFPNTPKSDSISLKKRTETERK